MRQVFIIHGGSSFSSYDAYLNALKNSAVDYDRLKYSPDWKPWLAGQLAEYDVLLPSFPNKQNASFDEWSVYFEKLLPYFGDDVRLVGHSLGAMFLAKYLQDQPMKQKVRQLILIAGGYDDDSYEDLGSFGVSSATNLPASTEQIHLFHSQDDPVVPFSELAKFQADLPGATSHIFESRAHFTDATFPELLEILQKG